MHFMACLFYGVAIFKINKESKDDPSQDQLVNNTNLLKLGKFMALEFKFHY